ncbi:hypothetical protein M409DRAFT_61714 [Zasmidium cellare ATCC 36951]|uniref:Transcription factor domain-containing protein n=1 Tax=Zasmidium cellare ATCC 36951 TaxID=1080233 RepID=A0A6A6BUF7_ZASCE|nr:uncharacterized protein M409DRAFT_61714 [Zasmidium cellare ATCC 36951]KAF2158371.1 hypothetical protein M409DRAFT_61714 [Zasmidium cellare ATCC 36951]
MACVECRQQKVRSCPRCPHAPSFLPSFLPFFLSFLPSATAAAAKLRERVSVDGGGSIGDGGGGGGDGDDNGSTHSPVHTFLNDAVDLLTDAIPADQPTSGGIMLPGDATDISSSAADAVPVALPNQTTPAATWWQVQDVPPPTADRSIGDLRVAAREIDECFALFIQDCLSYVPLVPSPMHPNICYAQSPLLFWTIVAIGSRKYTENPTLVILLGPKVSSMAKMAIFRQEPVLMTLQAFVLLCAWPMPFHALSDDITSILAAAALQLAAVAGLHIRGNGQEFSRTKVSDDADQTTARGRLRRRDCNTRRHLLITRGLIRVITTNGTPPLMMPDTYHIALSPSDQVLSPSLVLQKSVSELLTTAILDLQKYALPLPYATLQGVLDPMIESAVASIRQLDQSQASPLDVFYVQAAELHILSFHLFKHRSAISAEVLTGMYNLAITMVEQILVINETSRVAECGPSFIARFLHSAAVAILRISRSDLKDQLDLERGRRAYFALIIFHRRHAVRQDDAFARFSIILTNLWTSSRIFKTSNGSFASLTVRSRARLGMSMVYDCFWWWRQEYGWQASVYEHAEGGRRGFPLPGSHQSPSEPFLDEDESMLSNFTTMADLEWPAFDCLMGDEWPPVGAEINML